MLQTRSAHASETLPLDCYCGEGSVLAHSVSPQLVQHPQKVWTQKIYQYTWERLCMSVAAALNSCVVCETGGTLWWAVPVVQTKVAWGKS